MHTIYDDDNESFMTPYERARERMLRHWPDVANYPPYQQELALSNYLAVHGTIEEPRVTRTVGDMVADWCLEDEQVAKLFEED